MRYAMKVEGTVTDQSNRDSFYHPEQGASLGTPQAPRFTKHELLSAYSTRVRTWVRNAEELALMNRSDFLRDVYAYAATYEQYQAGEIFECLKSGSIGDINVRPDWLNHLGRLVALQNFSAQDTEFAFLCLNASMNSVPLRSTKIRNIKLQIELLAELGEFDQAETLLNQYADILDETTETLAVDLRNPFANPKATSVELWLADFNKPLELSGLSGISLTKVKGTVFDAVRAEPNTPVTTDGPLVSVIMTSYGADESALEHAVASILNQTWRNLELVFVDDASPGGTPQILQKLAESDSRLKIIELPENRGTYYARNVGLKAAQGIYATGQDSDDWSHPDRIYSQVTELYQDAELVGTVGQAMRTDDNLFRVLRNVDPIRMCEVSLMFHTDTARQMGGYLESRKGADSEFRMRLERFTGKTVKRLDMPFYLTRLSTGSLSRGEFRSGWAHPTRRAFLSFVSHWHETASESELILAEDQSKLGGLPQKFQSLPSQPRHFDYVYLCDWRHDTAATRSALAEIRALKAQGRGVGIMQLAGVFPDKMPISRVRPFVQQEINTGELDLVIPDEGATIENLIVKSAELLQFAPLDGSGNTVGKLFVVADRPPSAWDGSSILYDPVDCSTRVEKLFGVRPNWLTQDPEINRFLEAYKEHIAKWPEPLPYVLPDLRARAGRRKAKIKSAQPVIGSYSPNIEELWPEEIADADKLWPENSDVRFYGTPKCFLRKYKKKSLSKNWSVINPRLTSSKEFYESLDYFVFYPSKSWPQTISYDALLAYSQGAVVLVPEQFEAHHQDTAVILDAEEVGNFIQADWSTGGVLSAGKSLEAIMNHESGTKFVEILEAVVNHLDVENTSL